MEKSIIKSRRKWYIYPSFLVVIFIFAILVYYIYAILFGKLARPLNGIDVMGFFYFTIIIVWAAPRLWYMRRVIVYSDRIEVKYLFHRGWNHQIMVKDVDCYCAEKQKIRYRNGSYVYYRIYLLTGNRLWLYISGGTETNLREMLSVLENYFGIPERNGTISLDSAELSTVRRGKSVELTDITEEEVARMKAQRQKRPMPCSTFKIPAATRFKYFFIENSLALLLLAGAVSVCLYSAIRKANTAEVSCLDATTQMPSKYYLEIDSIDIDSAGINYAQSKKKNYPEAKRAVVYSVAHWFFKVKGRNDVWIAITSLGHRAGIREPYDREFCIATLHKPHTYKHSSAPGKRKDLAAILGKEMTDDVVLLVIDDDSPIETGGFVYEKAYSLQEKPEEAFPLMKQAAEMGYLQAQYELGLMYEYGTGTPQDQEQAIYWYKTVAAQQTNDVLAKTNAMNQLSCIYADQSQYEKALDTINEAIAIYSENVNLYDSKGEILYKSGDLEGAKDMWGRVQWMSRNSHQLQNSKLYQLFHEEDTPLP